MVRFSSSSCENSPAWGSGPGTQTAWPTSRCLHTFSPSRSALVKTALSSLFPVPSQKERPELGPHTHTLAHTHTWVRGRSRSLRHCHPPGGKVNNHDIGSFCSSHWVDGSCCALLQLAESRGRVFGFPSTLFRGADCAHTARSTQAVGRYEKSFQTIQAQSWLLPSPHHTLCSLLGPAGT